MDCQVTYKGEDYTYDQFATLLHNGELEVLAPKMDSRYFIVNEGYNPFERKSNNILDKIKSLNLQTLNKLSNEYIKGARIFKRYTQAEIGGISKGGEILSETILYLGANESTSNEIDQSESQEALIEEYARAKGIWVENTREMLTEAYGEPIFDLKNNKNQESIVFAKNNNTLIKSQNTAMYGFSPMNKIDSIVLQNTYFKEGAVKVIGYGRDENGDFQVIVEQPFIKAHESERVTEAQIKKYLSDIGFEKQLDNNQYTDSSQSLIVDDLHTANVILTPDSNLVVFDPLMRMNTPQEGYDGKREIDNSFDTELLNSIENKQNEQGKLVSNQLRTEEEQGISGVGQENALDTNIVQGVPKSTKDVDREARGLSLSQAKKNLNKAWNKLGNQGIVYDPIQNERDFIDFVKALFDYVKVYGRDKAIPEMVNYVKGKLGIGEGGGLNKKTSDSVKDFATQILEKYNALTPKEINAVLTAYSEQVGKGAFEKNVDTLLKFGKLSIEKAQQFKELYQEVSDVKSRGEEERAKLNKDKIKFESPIQILSRDMGDNPDGVVLTRLTAITTDENQQRTPEELQRDATYVEETLPRLRNIAFDDASMVALYYKNSPDWVDKFLSELESEKVAGKKGEKIYDVPSVRIVGILNVMNNVTYENIMKSTDPIEKENLLKLRKRLDAYTNDFMRGISLALGARRSDALLSEFARGGVMSDYATSRILTKAQFQQIEALQKAITSIPTKIELNDVNIPSDNPIKKTKPKPSTTKEKQKATTKKIDAKFESEMKEKAKSVKKEERERKAKDLRDRLFNAINKCK